jgi:hypothetical protein
MILHAGLKRNEQRGYKYTMPQITTGTNMQSNMNSVSSELDIENQIFEQENHSITSIELSVDNKNSIIAYIKLKYIATMLTWLL